MVSNLNKGVVKPMAKPALLLKTSYDPKSGVAAEVEKAGQGVVSIKSAAPGATEIRVVVELRRLVTRGAFRRTLLALTANAGQNPTTIDFHLLSTVDLATPIAALIETVFLIYSNVLNPFAVSPKLIINDVRPEEIDFITATGKVQLAIVINGGGGATDLTFDVALNGDTRTA